MFIGNETCKLFNHNLLALEQRNYFMYGQLCSLATLQGSPAPSFLSPTLADYIIFGELSRAQSRIDDVFDKEARDKLKELKSIEDPEEFKRVASFECALRFDTGIWKPIVTIEDKVKMLHIITLHYTLLQSLAEVNQVLEELKLNGLLESMRQHPYETRKLFIYENNQISGEELDDLLVPLFAKPGSNKRELEEKVSLNFTRYLEDVNDAKVKGTIEDFDAAEKCHVVITAGMVLQFITGSCQVPALKFDPVPSVQFLHDDSGRKMNANTCSNTPTLAVSSKYLDYNFFPGRVYQLYIRFAWIWKCVDVFLHYFVMFTEGIQVCCSCILNKQLCFYSVGQTCSQDYAILFHMYLYCFATTFL